MSLGLKRGLVMNFSLSLSSIVLLCATIAVADTPNDQAKLDAWHQSMARVPLPKKGCFTVSYPSTTWQEVPCGKPPARSYGPAKPYLVGHGINFEAITGNNMTSATGSFDSVNVASETDNGMPDIYSLQLNSGFFSAPAACAGGSNNCQGWQQYIYSSGLQTAFIEYWLLHYMAPCPPGWTQVSTSCVMNSVMLPVGPQPISNLKNMTLQGTAVSGGGDTITVGTPATISAMYQDNVLDLANDWKKVEFGVFGDGGGDNAVFLPDPGSTMAVRTTVDDGTMNVPTCTIESTTAETNSLNLIQPCCAYGGAKPAIVYWLSNNPNATSTCVNGTSIGDTHLTNFNNLYYDFQATGDFLLAQTDPGFVVQTRQESGAPIWPNASVNKAVAMTLTGTREGRTVTTHAAVCLDPARLIVDGTQRDLADGQSLSLPGGIHIARGGNTYLFTRPDGNNVTADVNSSWINVSVGLGHVVQAKVLGLLGNVNGNMGPDDLATRQGLILKQPLEFDQFYHLYADSWRLTPRESLVSQMCGGRDVMNGFPRAPFYAENLTPEDFRRGRTLCTEAGVRDAILLDACTLDAVVLGERAVRAYVRAQPPRAEVRVTQAGRK